MKEAKQALLAFSFFRTLPLEIQLHALTLVPYSTLISVLFTSRQCYELVDSPFSFFKNWSKNQTSEELFIVLKILLQKKLTRKYLFILNGNFLNEVGEKKIISFICKFGGDEEVISFFFEKSFY